MGTRRMEMDILRGLAILSVVIIHISAQPINAGVTGPMEVFYVILNQVTRFAVPAFLLLSGMGLTISGSGEDSYFRFLKKRLSKILPLYLFLWHLFVTCDGAVALGVWL